MLMPLAASLAQFSSTTLTSAAWRRVSMGYAGVAKQVGTRTVLALKLGEVALPSVRDGVDKGGSGRGEEQRSVLVQLHVPTPWSKTTFVTCPSAFALRRCRSRC